MKESQLIGLDISRLDPRNIGTLVFEDKSDNSKILVIIPDNFEQIKGIHGHLCLVIGNEIVYEYDYRHYKHFNDFVFSETQINKISKSENNLKSFITHAYLLFHFFQVIPASMGAPEVKAYLAIDKAYRSIVGEDSQPKKLRWIEKMSWTSNDDYGDEITYPIRVEYEIFIQAGGLLVQRTSVEYQASVNLVESFDDITDERLHYDNATKITVVNHYRSREPMTLDEVAKARGPGSLMLLQYLKTMKAYSIQEKIRCERETVEKQLLRRVVNF